MRRYWLLVTLCFALFAIFSHGDILAMSVNKKVIVIDAGHGGWDPGKIGKGDVLEKDINLAIAQELQVMLEGGGATVFLTRAGDDALGDKKNTDLAARVAMPTDMQAQIFVSIHQNAYHTGDVHGAQTFYYGNSAESERLAECVQGRIRSFLDAENRKEAKADKNYYLLKKSETPAIIVECGFLTNDAEARQLAREDYQEKVAWAIYMGILDYFAQ